MRFRFLPALFGCLALVLLAATAQAAAPALTVQVTRPERRTWPVDVPASGWLKPWQEAVIASEIGGQRIKAIFVDVGSVVKKGQLLAQLTDASIRNDIAQQTASVDQAQAALDQAQSDADRARRVTGSGALSQQAITQYEIAVRTAKAKLASAKAGLASAQLALSETRITAVDDGIISSRSAALGAVAGAGQELFRMIRQGRIDWHAEVPLRYVPRIKPGDAAVIPSEFGTLHGAVRLIAPTASATSGRVTVYVALNRGAGAPHPPSGIFVSGRIELGQSPALTVPASAIVERDGYSYVFAMKGADTVTRKRVETGRRQGDRVEVTAGLAADARVVVAGGAFLSDGATVKVVGGAPVPEAADGGAGQ